MGFYVGSSHPKIRLEIVEPACTLLNFHSWDREKKEKLLWTKIIYANCWSIELVNLIEHRMFHLLRVLLYWSDRCIITLSPFIAILIFFKCPVMPHLQGARVIYSCLERKWCWKGHSIFTRNRNFERVRWAFYFSIIYNWIVPEHYITITTVPTFINLTPSVLLCC